MEHVYASIDLGSDSIKLVVCELYQNHLNLLAATSIPSRGIKKGLIVDPELAKKSILLAFKQVEDMLGIKIKKVIACIPNHMAEYKIIKVCFRGFSVPRPRHHIIQMTHQSRIGQ